KAMIDAGMPFGMAHSRIAFSKAHGVVWVPGKQRQSTCKEFRLWTAMGKASGSDSVFPSLVFRSSIPKAGDLRRDQQPISGWSVRTGGQFSSSTAACRSSPPVLRIKKTKSEDFQSFKANGSSPAPNWVVPASY